MRQFMMVIILCGAVSASAWAAPNETLLLSDGTVPEAVIKDLLGGIASFATAKIQVIPAQNILLTDEKTNIPFAALFGSDSLAGSTILKALQQEYRPDLLLLVFLDKGKIQMDDTYKVGKYDMTFRLRWVQAATGATLLDTKLEYTSRLGGLVERQTDTVYGPGQQTPKTDFSEEFKAALTPEKVKEIGDQLAKALESGGIGADRLRILIRNVDQKEYMQRRDDFLALVRDAGSDEKVWDAYEDDIQEITVRSTLKGEFESYFRALYRIARERGVFDRYEMRKASEGNTILLTKLAPNRKLLVISGLSGRRYHDRLAIYQEALAKQPGVKDIEYRFITDETEPEAATVFLFTYDGDLTAFEARLWETLKADSRVPNRELVSITEDVIHYRTPYEKQDELTMAVVFNNITPEVFRTIGTPLDGIVKGLEVRNLQKGYDRDAASLTYTFDVTKAPVEMDAILWAAIQQNPALDHIVQDTTMDTVISYFYLADMDRNSKQFTITIRRLAPTDYKNQGRQLVNLVQSMPGVSKFEYAYDEGAQALVMNFESDAPSVYAFDNAIWAAAANDPSLAKLAMGSIGPRVLEYFFDGSATPPARLGELSLLLTNVTGQDYIRIAAGFYDLLRNLKDVRDVTYSYDFPAKTAAYRLKYDGEKLGDFEDALQRQLSTNELLKNVAKGPTTANRLEYEYHKPDAPPPAPVTATPQTGEDFLLLIKKDR